VLPVERVEQTNLLSRLEMDYQPLTIMFVKTMLIIVLVRRIVYVLIAILKPIFNAGVAMLDFGSMAVKDVSDAKLVMTAFILHIHAKVTPIPTVVVVIKEAVVLAK